MKKLIILLLTINLQAQTGDAKVFLSLGLDPVIASGLKKLDGSERPGAGSLNIIAQFGIEEYNENKIGYKFGLQYERFKNINYVSGGVFAGITYNALKVPFTDLTIGNYWYTTLECNIISRKGITDSKIYNPNSGVDWALGINLGVKIQKPLNLPFDIDLLLNGKDREDIRVHYGSKGFKDTFVISSYVMLIYQF